MRAQPVAEQQRFAPDGRGDEAEVDVRRASRIGIDRDLLGMFDAEPVLTEPLARHMYEPRVASRVRGPLRILDSCHGDLDVDQVLRLEPGYRGRADVVDAEHSCAHHGMQTIHQTRRVVRPRRIRLDEHRRPPSGRASPRPQVGLERHEPGSPQFADHRREFVIAAPSGEDDVGAKGLPATRTRTATLDLHDQVQDWSPCGSIRQVVENDGLIVEREGRRPVG